MPCIRHTALNCELFIHWNDGCRCDRNKALVRHAHLYDPFQFLGSALSIMVLPGCSALLVKGPWVRGKHNLAKCMSGTCAFSKVRNLKGQTQHSQEGIKVQWCCRNYSIKTPSRPLNKPMLPSFVWVAHSGGWAHQQQRFSAKYLRKPILCKEWQLGLGPQTPSNAQRLFLIAQELVLVGLRGPNGIPVIKPKLTELGKWPVLSSYQRITFYFGAISCHAQGYSWLCTLES